MDAENYTLDIAFTMPNLLMHKHLTDNMILKFKFISSI